MPTEIVAAHLFEGLSSSMRELPKKEIAENKTGPGAMGLSKKLRGSNRR